MSLDHILLGQLRQPSTGYELGKEFDDSAGHFWPAERSQIYPTLKKLEKKGWLTCTEQPSERGPRRKVYETTPEGFEELRRWLTEGPQIGRERIAYIAQVFHLGALDDFEAGLTIIRQMQSRWQQTLALFEFIEEEVVRETGDWQELDPADFFPLASLRTGLHLMRAKLSWCNETIEQLETRIGSLATAGQETH